MSERTRYTLELVDAAASGDAPCHIRLRALLKAALRRFAFRATLVAEAKQEQADDAGASIRETHDAHEQNQVS